MAHITLLNKRFTKRLFFPLMVACTLLLTGWADTLESIKTGLGEMTSLSAEFTQEKHMRILARPLISKGIFYYQAPMSLRWEYRTPVKSILLMHRGAAKRYIQKETSLVQEADAGVHAMQIGMQEIMKWMAGRFDENSFFTVRLEARRKIVLTPVKKSFSKIIQRIELALSERPGIIESVTLFESGDSYTLLRFNNTVLNQPIAETLFKDK